jgi:hypothetical protein
MESRWLFRRRSGNLRRGQSLIVTFWFIHKKGPDLGAFFSFPTVLRPAGQLRRSRKVNWRGGSNQTSWVPSLTLA